MANPRTSTKPKASTAKGRSNDFKNIKAEMLKKKQEMMKKKAAAKLAASKNKKPSPNKNKGKVKENKLTSSKPKPKFKYERIEAKSEYKPKYLKSDDTDLKLQEESPAKKVVKGKIKLKSGTVIKSKENTKTGKYKETIKKKGQKKIVNKGTESPMNMSGRSYDMKKAYDKNLPMSERFHYLENERHDAPGKMKGSPYHMSNELKYGGPVIDQMQTLSQISASKVLRHMKK